MDGEHDTVDAPPYRRSCQHLVFESGPLEIPHQFVDVLFPIGVRVPANQDVLYHVQPAVRHDVVQALEGVYRLVVHVRCVVKDEVNFWRQRCFQLFKGFLGILVNVEGGDARVAEQQVALPVGTVNLGFGEYVRPSM